MRREGRSGGSLGGGEARWSQLAGRLEGPLPVPVSSSLTHFATINLQDSHSMWCRPESHCNGKSLQEISVGPEARCGENLLCSSSLPMVAVVEQWLNAN